MLLGPKPVYGDIILVSKCMITLITNMYRYLKEYTLYWSSMTSHITHIVVHIINFCVFFSKEMAMRVEYKVMYFQQLIHLLI